MIHESTLSRTMRQYILITVTNSVGWCHFPWQPKESNIFPVSFLLKKGKTWNFSGPSVADDLYVVKNAFKYFMSDIYSEAHKKFIDHDVENLQGAVFKPKESQDFHKKSTIYTKF